MLRLLYENEIESYFDLAVVMERRTTIMYDLV
jgi:hypothetical protein